MCIIKFGLTGVYFGRPQIISPREPLQTIQANLRSTAKSLPVSNEPTSHKQEACLEDEMYLAGAHAIELEDLKSGLRRQDNIPRYRVERTGKRNHKVHRHSKTRKPQSSSETAKSRDWRPTSASAWKNAHFSDHLEIISQSQDSVNDSDSSTSNDSFTDPPLLGDRTGHEPPIRNHGAQEGIAFPRKPSLKHVRFKRALN